MTDPQLMRLLSKAFDAGGNLSVSDAQQAEDVFLGITRASQLGLLKFEGSSGAFDAFQYWRLTKSGYLAVGASAPQTWIVRIAGLIKRLRSRRVASRTH